MKNKQYHAIIIRALSTLLIGALVVAFPTNATKYLVVSIGLLFLIPGVVSIISYFKNRHKQSKAKKENIKLENDKDSSNNDNNTDCPQSNQDNEPKKEQADKKRNKPIVYFPIIGLGSIFFGAILVAFPTAFKEILIYLLGAFITIAAIAQAINLYKLSKIYRTSFVPYIISALICIAGIVVVVLNYKQATIQATEELNAEPYSEASTIFGIASVIYGISEIFYALYFRKPELKNPEADNCEQNNKGS